MAETPFDPVEYVDTLIAAGYEPSVARRRDGSTAYIEMRPRVLTDAEFAACNAAWAKLNAAPDGIDRVKAEYLRRGLVD